MSHNIRYACVHCNKLLYICHILIETKHVSRIRSMIAPFSINAHVGTIILCCTPISAKLQGQIELKQIIVM